MLIVGNLPPHSVIWSRRSSSCLALQILGDHMAPADFWQQLWYPVRSLVGGGGSHFSLRCCAVSSYVLRWLRFDSSLHEMQMRILYVERMQLSGCRSDHSCWRASFVSLVSSPVTRWSDSVDCAHLSAAEQYVQSDKMKQVQISLFLLKPPLSLSCSTSCSIQDLHASTFNSDSPVFWMLLSTCYSFSITFYPQYILAKATRIN